MYRRENAVILWTGLGTAHVILYIFGVFIVSFLSIINKAFPDISQRKFMEEVHLALEENDWAGW